MQKFRIPFAATLPPVELFLKDIYDLIDIIDQYTSEWHLETDCFKFNDIDDLKRNLGEKTLPSLHITDAPSDPAGPGFWVSISPTQVGVNVWPANENDLAAEMTFRHLEEFLLTKKRHVSFFSRYAYILWSGAFLFLVALVSLRFWLGHYLVTSYLRNANFVISLFLAAVWLLAASYLWWNRRKQTVSVIHLAKRPELPAIWERMNGWINVKGQVSNLIGQIIKWALLMGAGAGLAYLYGHWDELF